MELNWSTFLLEIINFLVLVWILKRFLYRPILSALEERRKKIEQSLHEATHQHTQAIALEQQYKERLDTWEHEKLQLRETLQQEIQNERTQKLEQLKTELECKRKKAVAIEQHQQAETLRQYQQKAHEQGARFATRLLNTVASKELESRLFDLLIETFNNMNEEQQLSLLDACKTSSDAITVTSAYTLSETQRQQLEQKICTVQEQTMTFKYLQDEKLLAGLRIVIGAWVLSINLQDELNGFVELAHENN